MAVAAPSPAVRPTPAASGRSRRLALAGVLALLALALAVRLVLLIRSSWLLEGDDALSALMALSILDHGDRPLVLKNQTYGGAWEPYGIALSFAAFGVSRVAAKLPALLGSLALVGSTWLLAREVAGRRAAWLAALLMAVPPVYDLVLSLKPWAPYTEVIVFGSLSLLAAVRLAFRRAGPREPLWALGCGAAGGVAFWLHPLAVDYLLPAAAVVLLRVRGRRLARVAALGLAGFVAGSLPLLIYNLETGGATLRFVLSGSTGQTADHLAVLGAWWNADLPRAAGLWEPWGRSPRSVGGIVAVLLALAVGWALLWRRWRRPRWRRLDAVLLLLAAIPSVLVLSGFGGPALNPWGFDATGRYAPPIWSGLTVVVGAFLAWAWQRRGWWAGALPAGALVACSLFSSAAADPVLAFESPYWTRLPADSSTLLATLRQDGVSHVWINHWAGQPLMVDARAAGRPLIAYDWYDVQAGGIDRFPEYLPLVRAADRAAYVLVTDEAEPELASRLREMGVSFTVERVPPYVVIIPTSRRVDPSEVTPALDYRY